MNAPAFLLLTLAIASVNAVIRHGDTVAIKYLCLDKNGTAYYYPPTRQYNEKPKCKGDLIVRALKYPVSKSNIEIGKGVRFQYDNTTICGLSSVTKRLTCAPDTPPTTFRILEKHNTKAQFIQDIHYVKIRTNASDIDCNGRPFQCKTKTSDTRDYGVIIVKL